MCVLEVFSTEAIGRLLTLATVVAALSILRIVLRMPSWGKMYTACEPIKAKVENIIKWYTPSQWALLISLTCTLVSLLVASTHVALYPDSYQVNVEDISDASVLCAPSPKIYTFGAVFLAGAVLNFKSFFLIPIV